MRTTLETGDRRCRCCQELTHPRRNFPRTGGPFPAPSAPKPAHPPQIFATPRMDEVTELKTENPDTLVPLAALFE